MSQGHNLTRRALMVGAGTTLASAALAVPYVNAAHPQQPASPSAAIVEAIADWNAKRDATALAWAEWDTRQHRAVFHGTDPRWLKWWDCSEEADAAQATLLDMLRHTDLDIATIYRRA